MASKKVAVIGTVFGIIAIISALYLVGRNYSNVQQAEKNVDTSCQVLKNRTIDLQNAFKEVENTGMATLEQRQSLGNAIQQYNDQCASRTGAL